MKKSKQELASIKLAKAEKLFNELELTLAKGEHAQINSELAILEESASQYATGHREKIYSACVRMYRVFHVSKTRYPKLTEHLKKLLRRTASRFFQSKPQPTRPHINQQLNLF